MSKISITAFVFAAVFLVSGTAFSGDWKETLAQRLPEYGHRNWIIIADSAYPKQSAPGIETIYTGSSQTEVLRVVMEQVDAAKHVRPVIMLDAELDSVSEKSAPGVDAYRVAQRNLFGVRPLSVMPHEEIIRKLDESSKLFNILLLKTDMTIPYTSVFIELDCGYWSAEKEKERRASIRDNVRNGYE